MIVFDTGNTEAVAINPKAIGLVVAAGRGTTIRLKCGHEVWVQMSFYDVLQKIQSHPA